MKALNSLILLLFLGNTFAQRTPFNNVVNITLPKESMKVTVNQLDSLIINNDEYLRKIKESVFMNADSYLIGTMLLQLNGVIGNRPNTLEEIKKSFDHPDDINPPLNHSSEIKAINNYRVLIMHLEGYSFNSSYYFFSSNNNNTKLLNGSLDYDKSDTSNRKRAADILDKILKSIIYK